MSLALRLLFLFLCGIAAPQVLAQGRAIDQLEEKARAAWGAERAGAYLELAEAQFLEGNMEAAYEAAEEAENVAKRLKLPQIRAKALNQMGQILLRTDKRKGLFGKERPANKFLQSNEILRATRTPDTDLLLDNLQQLRNLAQRAGRYEDLPTIDVQIAELRGGTPTVPPLPPLPNVRVTTDSAQARATRYLAQSQTLQDQLAATEAALSRMNETQMRDRMLLMSQQQLLDSMVFRSRVDSLSLANRNLALREAQSARNLTLAIAGGLLLLALGAGYSFLKAQQNARLLREKNALIETERERSENLLLNILPALVADELKKNGRTSARFFEDVGVLFADFVNFSSIAEQISPQELVSDLDQCFKEFDHIVAQYGLEKIKTIGDAYMCAGGLPHGDGSRLADMVRAAMAMQNWLHQWNQERERTQKPRYDARIGIHRGPVVAGVVGSKKFAFDIWGDTVNIAARIEQAGEGGKINLSGEVFEVIKDQITCRYRGKIAVKNKGEIEMYFVEN
jgi:adenylate cyclase